MKVLAPISETDFGSQLDLDELLPPDCGLILVCKRGVCTVPLWLLLPHQIYTADIHLGPGEELVVYPLLHMPVVVATAEEPAR